MVNVRELLEEDTNSGLAGVICWFSVSPENVDANALNKAFDANGLDKAFLPPSIRPVDAFRKATRHEKSDSSDRLLVFCRDLASGSYEVVRQLCLSEKSFDRNVADKTMNFIKAGTIRFDRASNSARYEEEKPWNRERNFNSYEQRLVEEWVSEFYQNLIKYSAYYDGNAIRAIVRNYLNRKLNAINLRGRGGGVYFVPNVSVEEFGKLAGAFEAIDGVTISFVPMTDSEKNGNIIAEAFNQEVGSDLSDAIAAVNTATVNGSITEAAYRRILSDVLVLEEKAKTYATHIQAYSETFETLYAALQESLPRLATIVK